MLLEKLQTIEDRYEKLTGLMIDPKVLSAPQEYQKYSKEQSELQSLVDKIREYKKLLADMEGAEEILKTVEYSYKSGNTTILDYLEAQRTYTETLLGYIDTLFRYQISKSTFESLISKD